MVRKTLVWTVVLSVLFMPIQDLWGADIEVGGGYTFNRYKSLHNAGVANINITTQEESNFPTEWSLGYIFAQDKNTDYKHNDEPTAWIGVGKRFRWKYLILGLGLVAVDQTSQRISSHLNFKPEAGFQFGPVVLLFQHISNTGLYGDNDGENFFTLSYSFSLDN